MPTRIQQYNGALDLLGQSPLYQLTDNTKERRALDRVWDESIAYCLSLGLWNFATRSSEMGFDDDSEPLFGYRYGFVEPEDYVRLVSISDTAIRGPELADYVIETGYWFANVDTIYVRYVSDDPAYGFDLSRWPQTFALAHQAYLAFKSGLPVTGDKGNRADMLALHEKWLAKSKVLDATEQRRGIKPMGRVNRARQSGYRGREHG